MICSSNMQNNIVSIEILEKSPRSDTYLIHLLLCVNRQPTNIHVIAIKLDLWDNATETDIAHYKKLTAENFTKLKICDVTL